MEDFDDLLQALQGGTGQRNPQCSGCHEEIFNFLSTDAQVVPVQGYNDIMRVNHACRTSSQGGGSVFVCSKCCKWSKTRPSQVRCMCKKKKTTEDTASNNLDSEGDNDSALDVDDSKGDVNDSGGDQQVDLGEDDEESPLMDDQSEMKMKQAIEDHFNDESLWSDASRKFFQRENRKAGDGKKGIIFNALINHQQELDFDILSEKDTNYHFHLTSTFHGMPQSKVHDVTAANHHMVKTAVEQKESVTNTLRQCFNDALTRALSGALKDQGVDIQEILREANRSIDQDFMSKRSDQVMKESLINHPTDYNKVRKKYLEGANSIEKNLPGPNVKELDGFAYIPIEHMVSHMAAFGFDFLSLEKDSDYEEYDGTFFQDLHSKVKKMKERSEVPEDVRVLLLRMWSDGFQVHHIKVDNEYNNLQLFTITLMEAKDCTTKKKLLTLPFALGFKKSDHSSIVNKLLEEVKEMEKWRYRFFGKERRMAPSLVKLQTVMEDYPEKCANTHTAQRGKYSHWWGHSSRFCESSTPSCRACARVRMDRVMDPNKSNLGREVGIEENEECLFCEDWWSRSEIVGGDIYPLKPEDDAHDPPPVTELSFKMLLGGVDSVHQYKLEHGAKATKKNAKKHLSLCCVSEKLATKIVDAIWNGEDHSSLVPEIWLKAEHYGIDLSDFVGLPMHGMTLGVEKTLIPQVHRLFHMRRKMEREAWKGFLATARANQRKLNNLYLDWCLAMPFSGKEKEKMFTANWQSEHYLCFTRLSLVHLGPLEVIPKPKDKVPIFNAFRTMRVLWFCVMSHAFSDDKVPSSLIDDYIKLFLSACNKFHKLAKPAAKKRKSGGAKKRKRDRESDTEDAEEDDEGQDEEALAGGATPFFITKVNFLNLLNVKEAIDIYGCLRDLWEGEREGYIQFVKKELKTMRHKDQFMQTILRKLITTSILEYMNEGNEFSKSKEYARKLNFKVYSEAAADEDDPSSALCLSDMISGVVIEDRLYVCFDNPGREDKTITLLPFEFDDDGLSRYNLWYAVPIFAGRQETTEDERILTCPSRDKLPSMVSDYFLSIPMIEIESDQGQKKGTPLHTVLLRSWRVRNSDGSLKLISLRNDLELLKNLSE